MLSDIQGSCKHGIEFLNINLSAGEIFVEPLTKSTDGTDKQIDKNAPHIAMEIFSVKTSMAYRCLNAYRKSIGETIVTKPSFRDGWLTAQPDGKSLIAEYYAVAPRIVANINRAANPAKIYETIREKYLEPCLNFIMRGDNLACKKLYVEMVTELKKIYS